MCKKSKLGSNDRHASIQFVCPSSEFDKKTVGTGMRDPRAIESRKSTWPNTLRSTNSEGKVSTKLQLRIPRSLRVLKTANDDAKFNDRQLASLSTYSFDLFSREWVTVSVCLVLWNNEWLHYNSIRQCLGVLIVKFPMNLVVWPWK